MGMAHGMGGNKNSIFSHLQSEEENQPSAVLHQLIRELRRTVTHSTVIAHQLRHQKHRVFDFNDLCDSEDDQQQSRNEMAEYVNLNANGGGRKWE